MFLPSDELATLAGCHETGQIIAEPFLQHLLTINIFLRKYNKGTNVNSWGGLTAERGVQGVIQGPSSVTFCRDFDILVSLLH